MPVMPTVTVTLYHLPGILLTVSLISPVTAPPIALTRERLHTLHGGQRTTGAGACT
jgi:hypothetical protein